MKKDDLEDLFKKSFENYEAEVNPSVWKNVRIGLKYGSLALLFNTILNKIGTNTIIALLSSAVVVISTAVILNKSKDADKSAITKTEQTPVATVEKPITFSDNSGPSITVNQSEENKNSDVADNKQKHELVSSTTLGELSKKDNKKTAPLINETEETIASIIASQLRGTAPLIVNFSNEGNGKTNKWIYSDGKNGNNASNTVHIFETPGSYSVILTSIGANGKTARDSIKIEVAEAVTSAAIEVSPNGDHKKDNFTVQLKNIASLSTKIYDSKGTLVYKSETPEVKWDGKDLEGKEAKAGIYFYTMKAEDLGGKKYEPKGSINLIR